MKSSTKLLLILLSTVWLCPQAFATDLTPEQLQEKAEHITRQHDRILENLKKKYDDGEISKDEYEEQVEWHEEELEERIKEMADAADQIVKKREEFKAIKKKVDDEARIQLKKRMAELEAKRRAEAEAAAKNAEKLDG